MELPCSEVYNHLAMVLIDLNKADLKLYLMSNTAKKLNCHASPKVGETDSIPMKDVDALGFYEEVKDHACILCFFILSLMKRCFTNFFCIHSCGV